jgi:hypothetical protein
MIDKPSSPEYLRQNPVKIVRCQNLEKGLVCNGEGLIMISGEQRETFRDAVRPAILQAEIEEFGVKISMISFPKDPLQYNQTVLPQDSLGFCYKNGQFILAIADGVTDPFNQLHYQNKSGKYADSMVAKITQANPRMPLFQEMQKVGLEVENENTKSSLQTGATTAQWLRLSHKSSNNTDAELCTIGYQSEVCDPIVENSGNIQQVKILNNGMFIGYKEQWKVTSDNFRADAFTRIFLRTDGFRMPANSIKPFFTNFKYGGILRHFIGFDELGNYARYLSHRLTKDDASMIIVELGLKPETIRQKGRLVTDQYCHT